MTVGQEAIYQVDIFKLFVLSQPNHILSKLFATRTTDEALLAETPQGVLFNKLKRIENEKHRNWNSCNFV
jgi:hypothetical protein